MKKNAATIRVRFLGMPDLRNKSFLQGLAAGGKWAKDLATDVQIRYLQILTEINMPLVEIDNLLCFMIWGVVLRRAADDFWAQFGDGKTMAPWQTRFMMLDRDFFRGFLQGALNVVKDADAEFLAVVARRTKAGEEQRKIDDARYARMVEEALWKPLLNDPDIAGMRVDQRRGEHISGLTSFSP